MFDKANDAAPSGDGRPKPDQLVDHLLIVRVVEHRKDNPIGITRTVGKNPDGSEITEPADCVIADVVDLDAQNPEPMYEYIFLQSKLIAHFKTNIGKLLIGTLGKYPDQGQRKGAYYFTDQSHIMRQAAVGEAWANNNREFFTTQAPGQATRKVATQSNVFQTQHQDSGTGQSTLELMRNQSNGSSEAPF